MRNYANRMLAVSAGAALWLGACGLTGCQSEPTRDASIPPPVDSPMPPAPAGMAQPASGLQPGDGPAGGLPPGGGPAGGQPPAGPGG